MPSLIFIKQKEAIRTGLTGAVLRCGNAGQGSAVVEPKKRYTSNTFSWQNQHIFRIEIYAVQFISSDHYLVQFVIILACKCDGSETILKRPIAWVLMQCPYPAHCDNFVMEMWRLKKEGSKP